MLYISIFLISLLGCISSFTDVKVGKIPNLLVFPMIAAAALLGLFSNNISMFFLNAFLAFLFGFCLYLARLWSAGDSKLFLAFAMLFPMQFYSNTLSLFPSFSLLLNSFIPAFIVLFLFSLFKTTTKQKIEAMRFSLQPKILASLAVILFAFYWLLFYVFSLIAFPLDFFLIVLILFLFISVLETIFPKKLVFVAGALSIVFAFLNFNELIQPNFWIVFVLILASMILLRFFILFLGFFAFGKRTEIKELKPGMVLLEGVFERNGLLEKKKLFFPSLVNALQDIRTNYVFNLGSSGLTAENISFLIEKNKLGNVRFHSLLVQETIPFAPLLFLGTILTFFCSFLFPWC